MAKEEIKNRIIDDILEHRLGAILYIRAFNICCHPNLESPISEDILLEIILDMIKSKKLEVVIPDPFLIRWGKKNLTNLKFLANNEYYVRKFHYFDDPLLDNLKKNEPLIDTRNIDKDNLEMLNTITKKIKEIIVKFPEMREKIILIAADSVTPLKLHFIDNILEKAEQEVKETTNEKVISSESNDKLSVFFKAQEEGIDVISKYRKNFMCVYITLLETIQKEMTYLQDYKFKIDNYMDLFLETLDAFKTYSIMFAEEAWTEDSIPVQKGIEIKTGKLYYSSITYKQNYFLIEGYQEYWALFNKEEFPELEDFLIRSGYESMGTDEETNLNKVGMKLELEFSFTTIEQIFFLCKYVFLANLFHMLFLIKNFFKLEGDINKIAIKNDNLSELFLPALKPLFNIEKVEPVKKMTFAYIDAAGDELNIIFNKYLFANAREIEQKLRFFQTIYKRNIEKNL